MLSVHSCDLNVGQLSNLFMFIICRELTDSGCENNWLCHAVDVKCIVYKKFSTHENTFRDVASHQSLVWLLGGLCPAERQKWSTAFCHRCEHFLPTPFLSFSLSWLVRHPSVCNLTVYSPAQALDEDVDSSLSLRSAERFATWWRSYQLAANNIPHVHSTRSLLP